MFDYIHSSYAYGQPKAIGTIKKIPEDFKVDEILGFDLTGQGEHLCLYIEKKGINTEDLAKSLAQTLNKSPKLISYAGLKDRHAVTRQWFSIHCPGEAIDPEVLQGEGWRVIEASRHAKKLRTGVLEGNRFNILIRDLNHAEEIEKRLDYIKQRGVPNYFGEQRFGHQGQNLIKAQRLLLEGKIVKNHFLRGVYYSSARAFLFNRILDERVKLESWNQAIAGDVMQLAGSNSIFAIEEPDDLIRQRISNFDISPTAALWGRGSSRLSLSALAIEERVLAEYADWCEALIQHRLDRAYRPLILEVKNLRWHWAEPQNIQLEFELSSGSYATTVLRELVQLNKDFE